MLMNAYELGVDVTAPPSVQTRLGCVPALRKKKLELKLDFYEEEDLRAASPSAWPASGERREQETVCAAT